MSTKFKWVNVQCFLDSSWHRYLCAGYHWLWDCEIHKHCVRYMVGRLLCFCSDHAPLVQGVIFCLVETTTMGTNWQLHLVSKLLTLVCSAMVWQNNLPVLLFHIYNNLPQSQKSTRDKVCRLSTLQSISVLTRYLCCGLHYKCLMIACTASTSVHINHHLILAWLCLW